MKKIIITIILLQFFILHSQSRTNLSALHRIQDLIGESIKINLGSDGKTVYATVSLVKQGYGNAIDPDPSERFELDEYSISFSDKEIPDIQIGCCDAILIWEGDFNGDGYDEFSVLQSPINGCMGYWQTYIYRDNNWKFFFDGFFVMSPYCDPPKSWDQYLDFVTSENENIYYLGRDINSLDLVKKKAIIK